MILLKKALPTLALLVFIALCTVKPIQAQVLDSLFMKGDSLKVGLVTEVGKASLQLKKLPSGETIEVALADIKYVRYRDGVRQFFDVSVEEGASEAGAPAYDSYALHPQREEMYRRGIEDGKESIRGNNRTILLAFLVLVLGFFTYGIFGIAISLAYIFKKPSKKELARFNPKKMSHKPYREGVKRGIRIAKSIQALKAWAIALTSLVLFGALITILIIRALSGR